MKGVNKTNKNFKIEMFSLHPARSQHLTLPLNVPLS